MLGRKFIGSRGLPRFSLASQMSISASRDSGTSRRAGMPHQALKNIRGWFTPSSNFAILQILTQPLFAFSWHKQLRHALHQRLTPDQWVSLQVPHRQHAIRLSRFNFHREHGFLFCILRGGLLVGYHAVYFFLHTTSALWKSVGCNWKLCTSLSHSGDQQSLHFVKKGGECLILNPMVSTTWLIQYACSIKKSNWQWILFGMILNYSTKSSCTKNYLVYRVGGSKYQSFFIDST